MKPRSAQQRVIAHALAHTCLHQNCYIDVARWARWCVMEGLGCGRGALLAQSLAEMDVPFAIGDGEAEAEEGFMPDALDDDLVPTIARAIEDAWQDACKRSGKPWEVFDRETRGGWKL